MKDGIKDCMLLDSVDGGEDEDCTSGEGSGGGGAGDCETYKFSLTSSTVICPGF